MEQSGEDRRPLSPGRAENGEKSCSPKHDFRRLERRKPSGFLREWSRCPIFRHVSYTHLDVYKRQVLPGRSYFIPQTMAKEDPLTVEESVFKEVLTSAPMKVQKALYNHFTGISPIMAEEICYLASVDADLPAADLSEAALTHLYRTFTLTMEDVAEGNFSPNIVYEGDTPVEFSALPLTCYSDAGRFKAVPFSSISQVLEHYYKSRSDITRIRQKSSDLRRVVQTALERNYKKYDLQLKQLKDTEKREKYRIYGELLNTYGYELSGGEKEFRCLNY